MEEMDVPDTISCYPTEQENNLSSFMATLPPRSGDDEARSDCEPNEYKMDRKNRGYAVIINNKIFRNLPTRKGTDLDRDRMYNLLLTLGFKAEHIEKHQDCTEAQMKNVLENASQKDYTDFDCFVAVILTHGLKDGDICGTDECISVETLTVPFKGTKCHPTLIGKPKIFFFQACRGEADDVSVVQSDAIEDEDDPDLQIPAEADFLLAFSVVAGYHAWRNEIRGTWYIESINKVFHRRWQEEDLVSMLTEVNKVVAIDYEYEHKGIKKQMPCFSSRLTKKVYFR